MTAPRRSNVRVHILGEEYNLRTAATPEETQAIARYVDATVREITSAGVVVETHKAAILACLRIAGELFQTRDGRAELAAEMEALSAEIRPWLPPSKRYD